MTNKLTNTAISRNIRHLRDERGWTMDEYYLQIAHRAENPSEMIAYQTMTNILSSPRRSPRETTLDAMAKPFGLPGWVLRIPQEPEFTKVRAMIAGKIGAAAEDEEEESGDEEEESPSLQGFVHRL